MTPDQIVVECNKRRDEALGRSLRALTENMLRNGAYMLMTSLAWTLKAWSTPLLPMSLSYRSKYEAERTRLLTMEFRTFRNLMIHVPCQTIRHARKVIHGLLNWTDLTACVLSLLRSFADLARRR